MADIPTVEEIMAQLDEKDATIASLRTELEDKTRRLTYHDRREARVMKDVRRLRDKIEGFAETLTSEFLWDEEPRCRCESHG